MSGFGDWMVDTFVYTGLLIALVLLLRRPVSRWCGPQVAYALWALPLLRFIMPPIVLPAWMAPAEPERLAASATEPLMVIISDPGEAGAVAAAETAAAAPVVGIAVTDLLLPLWLGGALVFLGWRIREYYRMRAELLAESIPVGDAGKVRLVETPAVSGPVAFGVFDKVVALPPAFMAHYDITARDMAIAHELAHHRGYDLVANIAAQPLLALHWFNPLAWWGWRAMRRDQEAACDARVVAGREQSDRVAYAQVIAGFAAGEHMALAAPMACPVLGEKSIIHRLRSLTMSEVSSRRRRLGIAAITTTALALPLTASISYAQAEAPPAPEDEQVIETIDPDTGERRVRIERRIERGDATEDGEHERHVEMRIVHADHAGEGEEGEHRIVRRRIMRDGEEFNEEEFEAMMERFEADMEAREGEIRIIVEQAMEQAEHAMEMGEHAREMAALMPQIEMSCDDVGESGVAERDLGNGRRALVICQSFINQSAIEGMREAMREMRNNRELSDEMREEALREMERAIEELQRERHTLHRIEAKVERRERAPNARAQAVAMRWSGRMVSPVAPPAPPAPAVVWEVAPPAPPAPPAAPTPPVSEADCESETGRA
ncbi:hypothetical protein OZN62_00840 [Aurantiacibacter sp. MUD11]|uniref:M56 family metallopeptidase n=1 Tax=Aurantiacibacter sp. MUD11 TaxID=3003265 RepID=UPI0022AAA251|nr:M56 family metallopeptidase [Aurantiacibacter sp. MUD11]WAT18156.1 hypothetical protein OZN62_00840 [Aurantiacibacter sp. MUD11]